MSWYIVQTVSKRESSAQSAIQRLASKEQLENSIRQVVLPTREETEYRDGRSRTMNKPLFPGYVFVEMDMTDELQRMVSSVYGVHAFITAADEDNGPQRPVPMSEIEIRQFLELESPQPHYSIQAGDVVTITEGPFADMRATVTECNRSSGDLTVHTSIFGRETPVTIHASQVIKSG